MMFPGQTLPLPDFEAMAKSWRRASTSQKVVRVGLLGGLVGTAIYFIVAGQRADRSAPAPDRGTYK